jgi:hypothetical protein
LFTRDACLPPWHQSRHRDWYRSNRSLDCNDQHPTYWRRSLRPVIFGHAPTVPWLHFLVWPALCVGTGGGMALFISAVLWWVALTVMVSAVALRWQVAHDRIGVRAGRHAVHARHRQ